MLIPTLDRSAQIGLAVGLAWLVYVYVGYPLLLAAFGALRRNRPWLRGPSQAVVSVLISAYNEEKDIGWKVSETLRWDYPSERLEVLIASDASTDRTDDIVKELACLDVRVRLIRMDVRGGKGSALNQLAAEASGELLFFTDANTHIEPTVLGRMTSYFMDQQVGCVTGVEDNTPDAQRNAITTGGRTYFSYESWINQLESRLGSVLVCDGSIFCMRKCLFMPLQPELANDLELPLRVGHSGYAILFDPTLRSAERATSSPGEEFQRRRRICAQGLLGMWRLRHELHGFRAWQFASRKLLRWAGLIPFVLVLASTFMLSGHPLFAGAAVLESAFLALAAIGFAASKKWAAISPALSVPFYFVLVNVAALVGLIDTILGRRYGVWVQPSSSRGTSVIVNEVTGAVAGR